MKILKINTLKKGRVDRNNLLLHACFQILVDFVEKESPFKFIDWNSDEAHINAAKEIRSLYRWWVKLRPNRPDYYKELEENEIPSFEEMSEPIYSNDGKTIDHYRLIKPPKKYSKYYKVSKKMVKLEIKCEEEDQKNLLRLTAIRQFLWV